MKKHLHTDRWLLMLCLAASVCGLVLIYSATRPDDTMRFVYTQIAATVLGVAAYCVISHIDVQKLMRWTVPLIAANLVLLGSLYFWGVGEGNRSWIRFGGIGVQPAELGKLLFLLSFAGHLAHCRASGMRARDVGVLIAHAAALCLCVMVFSRDDGMTLAYAAIALTMAFAAGVRGVWFAMGTAAMVGCLPLAWTFVLNSYQRARILAVFYPEAYPDTAYQAQKTAQAIARGGVWGEGFLRGTATQAGRIPTQHTDAIFAVVGEELGWIGCAAILVLLALIIARCFAAAWRAQDDASALLATGCAGMLLFQTVLNIGMNLGVLPVVGLTLPFFSYGGTSVLTMYIAMGFVSSVRRCTHMEHIMQQDNGG